MGTPCPMHRWLWEPCPWRADGYLVRCEGCGAVSYLATMVLGEDGAVRFIHEAYQETRDE